MVSSVVRPSSTFSTHFSSKTTGPISIKFHMQLPSKGEREVYIFGPGHIPGWPPWPPWPYMVKNLKNLLLQNHWADCLETWYVAFGKLVLYSLYK